MSEIKLDGDIKTWNDTRRRSKGVVLSEVERSLLSAAPDSRQPEFVHPSEVSKSDWCERATYNRILVGEWPKESFNLIRENIFAEGDFIHEKWQKWMGQTGKLWGLWECVICREYATCTSGELDEYVTEDRMHVWEDWKDTGDPINEGAPIIPSHTPATYCSMGYGEPLAHDWHYREVPVAWEIIRGHEDGAIGNHLVEIKSVGLGTLRQEHNDLLKKHYCGGHYNLDGVWKELKRPLISHQIQGQLYLYMAQQMGLPFEKLAIIYEFKPNQQVKEFDLPFNMKLLAPILKRIDTIKYALEGGEPPVCPYGGCKYCEKGKAKSTEISAPGERVTKGAARASRSARKRSNDADGGDSRVGELRSSRTGGSGGVRKVRRRNG